MGSEQPTITAALVQNGSNVSSEVEDGIGKTPQVIYPPAALNARASSSPLAAAARRSTSATAGVGGSGIAVADLAATTAISDQDAHVLGAGDKNCVGQSLLAGCALVNSFLSVAAEAAQMVDVTTADRVDTTTCTDGCVGPCGGGHAGTFVPAAILAVATAHPAVANPYLQAGPQAATPARGKRNGVGDRGKTGGWDLVRLQDLLLGR